MSVKTVSAGVQLSPEDIHIKISDETKSESLRWYFLFFFISGFCSILYELIWLRLAMAQFGVTTPMVSIVLSCFMGGLGVGSWAAGRLIRTQARRLKIAPLQVYALTELLIGCGGVVVPLELLAGRYALEHIGNSLSLSSSGYYVAAGVWLAFTLLPWCACMGATIPVAMFTIRCNRPAESNRSFSFLYLANVLGALAGTIIPLLFIELWGFNRTLQCGMALNLLICATAYQLGKKRLQQSAITELANSDEITSAPTTFRQMLTNGTLWLLFATGLTSMGMEVVWTRQFTIFVGTLVYSFATILGVYLAATFLGSVIYRRWIRRYSTEGTLVWMFVCVAALMPLLTADVRLKIAIWLRLPLGLAGFSGLLGFLTPSLVDRYSDGDPDRAGVAYAVNVAGCILGPLVAGFLLLPYMDERYALATLTLPWVLTGMWFAFAKSSPLPKFTSSRAVRMAVLISCLAGSAALVFLTQSYIQRVPGAVIRRDNTATVLAIGQGMQKNLVVNGVTMTQLTPLTKAMAAMPLAMLNHPPKNALVICFGMGTTHRSMLSWGIDSTAVDLVPSVPALFSYFHADALQLARSPKSHIVIDDGRRFLERTTEQYDVIAIDPPPPIGAAGSSLLYSREFYGTAKKRLKDGGILAQWFPGGDRTTASAIARSLKDSFPYVRAYGSFIGVGVHFFASMQPIPNLSAERMAQRMPPQAAADFVEWGPFRTPEQQYAFLLKSELPIDWLISLDKNAPALTDDRPINEYGILRVIGLPPY
jgi:spermidine synthase